MNSTQEFVNNGATWGTLIFGTYSSSQVRDAVSEPAWQLVRLSMKGESMRARHAKLRAWLQDNRYSPQAKVQVTNYVYALKRGGMWK